MRFAISLMLGLASLSAAHAQTLEFRSQVPFSVQLLSLTEEGQGGQMVTIVTADVQNGPHFLRSARFQCEARNDQGNTWDVTGEIASVAPNETKKIRLISALSDAPFTKAIAVTCDVAAFDASIL